MRRRLIGPSRPATRILELCVASGGCLTGEHGVGIEKRDLMRVQFHRDRPRCADANQDRVRPEVAVESGQGLSLEGRKAAQQEAA